MEGELYDQGDLRAIIDAHREEHSTEEDQRPAGAEVDILCVCAWSKGFAVGGTRGYLGVFQLDARAVVECIGTFWVPGSAGERAHSEASARLRRLLAFTRVVPGENCIHSRPPGTW